MKYCLFVLALGLSGCAGAKREAYDRGFKDGYGWAQTEFKLKDERLRKFNQINEDGTLRVKPAPVQK